MGVLPNVSFDTKELKLPTKAAVEQLQPQQKLTFGIAVGCSVVHDMGLITNARKGSQSGFHVGQCADPYTQEHCERRGHKDIHRQLIVAQACD